LLPNQLFGSPIRLSDGGIVGLGLDSQFLRSIVLHDHLASVFAAADGKFKAR